jgi:3-oxoacyl-[acyl-carrier-protein] synthase-3
MVRNAPEHYQLCQWGLAETHPASLGRILPSVVGNYLPRSVTSITASEAGTILRDGVHFGLRQVGLQNVVSNLLIQFMSTDAAAVLKHGVDLGTRTWQGFSDRLGWRRDQVDKVICHQVGAGHREAVLQTLGISPAKDFSTYEYLGNIGTVSLPLTAAIAEERDFLRPGDRVGFLGIGSGLNCLMLGLQW